jgi:SAM-dependent methyltransferase
LPRAADKPKTGTPPDEGDAAGVSPVTSGEEPTPFSPPPPISRLPHGRPLPELSDSQRAVAAAIGGHETGKLLAYTSPYCLGLGVDLGCEADPHPAAHVLVDGQGLTHDLFGATREVHIRDVEALFPDWPGARFDFVYSSHLIEHLRDPWAFLAECFRLVRPGGHVVVVGPHEDWYWPAGHPDANPDHAKYNWSLDQDRVRRWMVAVCPGVEILKYCEFPRPDNWSFLVVGRKPDAGERGPPGRG